MSQSPKNIQVIGDELAIAWNDGKENYYPLKTLRKACPCASCGGEPDVMGRTQKPHVHYSSTSFQITNLNIVGGYALQPTWGDRHDTGLYSWKYLHALGEYIENGGGHECCHEHDDQHECEHHHHEHHHHEENGKHHCCGGHGHGHGHCKDS